MENGRLRYLLKRGKESKSREKVLQQYMNGKWIEVRLVYEVNEELIEGDCPLGGDISNDCKGCVYSAEYHYDYFVENCMLRKEKRGVNKK